MESKRSLMEALDASARCGCNAFERFGCQELNRSAVDGLDRRGSLLLPARSLHVANISQIFSPVPLFRAVPNPISEAADERTGMPDIGSLALLW
jgi:hypothetical protein